jgi:hypothetical protein
MGAYLPFIFSDSGGSVKGDFATSRGADGRRRLAPRP